MENNIISLAKARRKKKTRSYAESAHVAGRLFFDKVSKELVEPDQLASGGDMTKILEEKDEDETSK